MSDVVEQDPRPTPRWLRPVVVGAVLLALAVYGIVNRADPPPGHGAAQQPVAPLPTQVPGSVKVPWPTVRGACGADVALPVLSTEPLRRRTGLEVLVGGPGLTRIDLDDGGPRTVVAGNGDRQSTALVRGAGRVYALTAPSCDARRPSTLARVTGSGSMRVRLDGPIQAVVAGRAGVWGIGYPDSPDHPVVLREVGGPTLRVPGEVVPVGVTRTGILVTVGDSGPDRLPGIAVLDPVTGKTSRPVGHGTPVAVGDRSVVWSGPGCDPYRPSPEQRCTVHRARLDRHTAATAFPLPAGRAPLPLGTLSADGRQVAFQLSRPRPDPVYESGHPGAPSDVAVLNLDTGRLHQVPGLEVPPKSGAGLAFSPDGRWLVVTVSEGGHAHLMLWRVGSKRLLMSQTRLAGPVGWAPPVLVVSASG